MWVVASAVGRRSCWRRLRRRHWTRRRKTHWAFFPLRIRAVALERDWLTYDQITADHSRIRTRPLPDAPSLSVGCQRNHVRLQVGNFPLNLKRLCS